MEFFFVIKKFFSTVTLYAVCGILRFIIIFMEEERGKRKKKNLSPCCMLYIKLICYGYERNERKKDLLS